ncbi:glutamyl-tRNA(Gln) amidotransferase subunit B, mitochondrial [Trichomonascus vanleenenianus]|uniref:glutamyl-tRNA(Gln) amidotransferase subunit PET112 n=1 Tax=Trichomonascus vanleenenianus TaxID=2268995 RepID=UPI003EC9EC7E
MIRFRTGSCFSPVFRRYYSTGENAWKLTCGLEIHAQLMTHHKLFSNSRTSFHAEPNSHVSFYDAAVPGTQPKFNMCALLLALKAAVALNCDIRREFSFDRKHYFYGDQPTGYQITQHYQPYAMNGVVNLYPRDGVPEEIPVRIKQIQIEQDTGKSTYIDSTAHIDLNRTNHGLIELVTEPDIPTPEAAGVFVKKLQMLLKHLGVCSGELESGAMRVDVNVSVNGGQRCEIKNLSSTSAIVHAIKAEFKRQKQELIKGGKIYSETRGWDGTKTWKLRGKEEGVDYRYMPDPELQPIQVDPQDLEAIRKDLPELPDSIFQGLLQHPYSVPLKDARTLMSVPGLVDYYKQVYTHIEAYGGKKPRAASNWIVHRYYGELNTLGIEFDIRKAIPPGILGDIILMVEQSKITSTSGLLLIKHLISNSEDQKYSIPELVEELDLGKAQESDNEVKQAIEGLCQSVIEANRQVSEQVRSGKKPKSIMFLVGQVMRECQGRVDANTARETLEKILLRVK